MSLNFNWDVWKFTTEKWELHDVAHVYMNRLINEWRIRLSKTIFVQSKLVGIKNSNPLQICYLLDILDIIIKKFGL